MAGEGHGVGNENKHQSECSNLGSECNMRRGEGRTLKNKNVMTGRGRESRKEGGKILSLTR